MLPPRTVPDDLTVIEYQRLLLRYQLLTWLPQMARVSKILLRIAPEDNMGEGDKRKMMALMTAVQASVFVTSAVNEVQDTANDVVKFAAAEGGKLLDKNELTRKAKDKASTAFNFVSQLANSAVHKVIEDVVLPHVGLPVNYVPEGGTASQYLTMAGRYEKIGYAEPMRAALKKAIASEGSAEEITAAKRMLATRVPRQAISNEATSKFLDALKFFITKKEGQSKELLLELLRDEPHFDWIYPRLALIELSAGDEERARDLIRRVLKQNADFIPAWHMLCNIELAAWKIDDLEKRLEKMKALDAGAAEIEKIESLLALINQGGMR